MVAYLKTQILNPVCLNSFVSYCQLSYCKHHLNKTENVWTSSINKGGRTTDSSFSCLFNLIFQIIQSVKA